MPNKKIKIVQPVDSASFEHQPIPPTTQAQDVHNNLASIDRGYDSRRGFGQANLATATTQKPTQTTTQKAASIVEPVLPWALASAGVIGAGMTAKDVMSKIRRRQRQEAKFNAMLNMPKIAAAWTPQHYALAGAGLLGSGIGLGYALRSYLHRTDKPPRLFFLPRKLQQEKTAGWGNALGIAFNVGFPAWQYFSGETSLGEAAGSMAGATAGWSAGSGLVSKLMSRLSKTRGNNLLRGIGTFAGGTIGSMALEPLGAAIGRRVPISRRKPPTPAGYPAEYQAEYQAPMPGYTAYDEAKTAELVQKVVAPIRKYLGGMFGREALPKTVAGTVAGVGVGGYAGNKAYHDAQMRVENDFTPENPDEFLPDNQPYGY